MKLVDSVIGGSTIEYLHKKAILKLCLKKRLNGYPWLLKYFLNLHKTLNFLLAFERIFKM